SQSSDAQISEVQTLQDEILAIQQNAANEKRQWKEQEIADIQNYNEQIRQIELEALGGTELEILYAKNEFAARVRTMDLESASELLQEKAKIRVDEIVQIQAAYDTEIQLLQSKLSTCKEEDRA
ncbi:phage tail tape measure protein, partial [[Ruminococcus] torques]|nr:phage tail tape measure protein [[Ruminococcus] torques]